MTDNARNMIAAFSSQLPPFLVEHEDDEFIEIDLDSLEPISADGVLHLTAVHYISVLRISC